MMEPTREPYHRYLRYFLSKDDSTATLHDQFMALAYAVRSEMVDRWIRTQNHYHESKSRRVYYLSPEYILGKSLHQNVISLGLLDDVRETAAELGFSLEEVFEKEDDLELGNGGKARQAACMQETLATLGYPGMGYGLRYDYGLFRQRIVDGRQVEVPYDWQNREHPWEIPRPEYQCVVHFGGTSEPKGTPEKRAPHWWLNTANVLAHPSDIPVPGYGCSTVNTLRLWSSRPAEEFPPEYAHHGDYVKACEEMAEAGRITRVLHPESDVLRSTPGRIRLQYFLVSTSLQDIVRRYKYDHGTIDGIEKHVVIHLSGSNCALAVPEMMHILVDIEDAPWVQAWEVTRNIFTYTSSAVSFEQHEIWPVYMIEQLLPRHMEIIYELNAQHLEDCSAKTRGNVDLIRDVSVIEEGEVKRVKMSHLALLGATCVTGVSRAQEELLRSRVFPGVMKVTGKPVRTITSGVAHRRWLLGQNPAMANVVTEAIGDGWVLDPMQLSRLEPLAADSAFLERFVQAKRAGKERLLGYLRAERGFDYDLDAMFDVQCMRIQPCKRQMLYLLYIVSRYLRLKEGDGPKQHRLHIFGGKAMPSDFLAKQTVTLIHLVADAINNDGDAHGRMHVHFLPDFGLTWADRLIAGVDLWEAIGAPLAEACPTSQFKVAFGGGISIASRGGVNDELIEVLGDDVVFGFGDGTHHDTADYSPSAKIYESTQLHASFNWLEQLLYGSSVGEGVFPLLASIRDNDHFRVIGDFDEYCAAQDLVDAAFADAADWRRRGALSLARAGAFSCDRAVKEYAQYLWHVEPAEL